jgi:hypothetical protein
MKRLAVIAILAASATSFAPQEPPGKPAQPAARQETFMASLKVGEFAKAYETLVKGSRIEEKQDQVANLRDQTEKGAAAYGGIVGWDNMGIVRQDKHQAFGIALLATKQVPVYFYFVWYRTSETAPWMLINVWFSDVSKDYWQLRW